MRDSATDVTCRTCGRPLVQEAGKGHRKRVSCNAACKMKERRRLFAEKQQVEAKQMQARIVGQ
jgi:hypothetical protein